MTRYFHRGFCTAAAAAAGAKDVRAVSGISGRVPGYWGFFLINTGIEKGFVIPEASNVQSLLMGQHGQNDFFTDAGAFQLNHPLCGEIKVAVAGFDDRDDRLLLKLRPDQFDDSGVGQRTITRRGLSSRDAGEQYQTD